MPSRFEEVCQRAEATGDTLTKAAKLLQRHARAMSKAAAEGHTSKVRQAVSQIREVIAEIQRLEAVVDEAWPLSDADLTAYLEQDFVNDLTAATAAMGITLNQLDDRLAAFPVIVQVLPNQRAVRVNTTRLQTLRPSVVADRIRTHTTKPPSRSEQFLETLYKAYRLLVKDNSERGALLLDIYDALTLLPDARRSYEKAEFYRDVYLVDAKGPRSTRSGATVTFSAATGTRGPKSFAVISPDGMPKYYYSVRFEEAVE